MPVAPLMQKGARVGRDGAVLPPAPRAAPSDTSAASESKSNADGTSSSTDTESGSAAEGADLEAAVASDPERLADALDELNMFCSSSDNSTILGAMGGMVPLIRLTSHSSPRVSAGACEALSTVVQNHPPAQALALRNGALHAVLRRLSTALRRTSASFSESEASTDSGDAGGTPESGPSAAAVVGEARVATKCVLALSSLLGGFAPAQDVALQMRSIAHDGAPGAASAPLKPGTSPDGTAKPAPDPEAEEQKTSEDTSAPAPVAAPPASGTSVSTSMIVSPSTTAAAQSAAEEGSGSGSSTHPVATAQSGDSTVAAAPAPGPAPEEEAGKGWLGEPPSNPPVLPLLLQAMLLRNRRRASASADDWPDKGRLRSKAARCLLRLLHGPRGLAVCAAVVGGRGSTGASAPREASTSTGTGTGEASAPGDGSVAGAWPLLGALAACALEAVPRSGGGTPLWEAGGVSLQVAETSVRCIGAVLRATAEVLLRGKGASHGGDGASSGAGTGGDEGAEEVAERAREQLRAALARLARASAREGESGALNQAIAAARSATEHAQSAPKGEPQEIMEDLLAAAKEASKVGALAIRKAA